MLMIIFFVLPTIIGILWVERNFGDDSKRNFRDFYLGKEKDRE